MKSVVMKILRMRGVCEGYVLVVVVCSIGCSIDYVMLSSIVVVVRVIGSGRVRMGMGRSRRKVLVYCILVMMVKCSC